MSATSDEAQTVNSGQQAPPDAGFAPFEPVTRPALISHLLQALCTSRSLLQVSVGGAATFRSAILALDADTGELILDELLPAAGHTRLVETGRATAIGSHNGGKIRFELVVNSVDQENGVYFYRIAHPRQIDYAQRRALHRVKVSIASGASLSVPQVDGGLLKGTIHDLSLGGVGALFPPDAPLQPGSTWPGAVLCLNEDDTVECTLHVASARRTAAHGHRLRVGAAFVDLPRAQRARVRQWVAALERAAIRKRQRSR